MTDLPPRLKDLLGTVGGRLGLEDTRATGLLWSRWAEVVGEAVADRAEPTSLKKGVLRIRATSPVWAQELTYLATEIRIRANELVGSEVVREVRVWTGPGEVNRPTGRTTEHPEDGTVGGRPVGLDGDPREAFERARRAWAARRSSNRREEPS